MSALSSQSAGCLWLGVLACCVSPVLARAQRVPLQAGNTVRLAAGDSAARALWRTGTVLTATRLGVLIRPSGLRQDTVPVPLNGSVRIQVMRRSRRSVPIGGVLGGALGGVLGGTVFRSTFDAAWGDPGVLAEVVGFGLLGGVVGLGAGLLARPVHWDEIPFTGGGFPMTPLTRSARPVPFAKRERWQAFPPTVEDFAAFFTHWQDSLDLVEGVWEREDASAVRFLPDTRVAIVRDGRYAGYDYVAVRLAFPGGATRPRDIGVVPFALRQAERPGFFDVRYTGGSERSGSLLVEFLNGRLEFRYGVDAIPERWVKLERGRE